MHTLRRLPRAWPRALVGPLVGALVALVAVAGLALVGYAASTRAQDKSERVWFVAVDGQQQGPMTTADVEKLIQSGKAKAESLVWREGRADWVPLSESKEFRAFFVKPPPLPPAAGTPPPLPPATGAPPPVPNARPNVGAPEPARPIVGAPDPAPPEPAGRMIVGAPAPEPPEPPPDPAAVEQRKRARAREDSLKDARAVRAARERAEAASAGVRNTALIWGGTTVGLAGAGAVAFLVGGSSGDATLQPACTVLGCGLCLGCAGTAVTGAVLTGLGIGEMVDADRDLDEAQKDARGMRY